MSEYLKFLKYLESESLSPMREERLKDKQMREGGKAKESCLKKHGNGG